VRAPELAQPVAAAWHDAAPCRYVKDFQSMDSDLAQFIDIVIAEQVLIFFMSIDVAVEYHVLSCNFCREQSAEVPIVLFSHRLLHFPRRP
jgi:hypothetical protein